MFLNLLIKINMKHLTLLLSFTLSMLFLNTVCYAQKVLSESETAMIEEAKANLNKALTNPALSESDRLKLVEQSAVKLKEYGQPNAYPQGETPLRQMMDENFEQCKDEIAELSNWSLNLEHQTLEQKIKLINTLQISVAEEQIKMLIPGSTPVSLSKDVINSVFDWNIVEGTNGGQRGDTQGLANRFKQLAQSKELIKKINLLVEEKKRSLALIDKDRDQLELLEVKLRQKYNNAEATTFTRRGYEGAVLAGSGNSQSQFKRNVLVGTWRFGYEQTGYFYWTFNNDGTWKFEDKMNDGEEPLTGKYSLAGNTLKLTGPKSQCEDVEGVYTVEIEPEEFSFKDIKDPCMSRRFTLSHVWKK
jgi:hypothetical protein